MNLHTLTSLALLAQEAPVIVHEGGASGPSFAAITGMVVAVISLLVLVPTYLALRHARRQREMEHAERLRALELGHPLPGSYPKPPSPAGVRIGLWVPLGVFGIAFIAAGPGQHSVGPWVAAAVVGTTAVVCGTVLTLIQRHDAPTTTTADPYAKPRIDPAAYEEIASRH